MYVYQRSEPTCWTVGYYAPDGKWVSESDHPTAEAAAVRAAWLNGSQPTDDSKRIEMLEERLAGAIKEIEAVLVLMDNHASVWGDDVRIGVVVRCPRGHLHTYRPSDPLSGRIYCTKDDCWSDGCQGDSGSGTHYCHDDLTLEPEVNGDKSVFRRCRDRLRDVVADLKDEVTP